MTAPVYSEDAQQQAAYLAGRGDARKEDVQACRAIAEQCRQDHARIGQHYADLCGDAVEKLNTKG